MADSRQKDYRGCTDSSAGTMRANDVGVHRVNESGHIQELERNFSLLSVCSLGIVTGSSWAALGGTITVAIYNGGPPGVIYELILASVFYWFIAASLAELASSMPSSAGVYHWASFTPGERYGRVCGFFAGWWNFLAWVFSAASMSSIIANIVVALYTLYHPDYVFERWHVFLAYIVSTWMCCAVVLFANRALPAVNNIGLVSILGGMLITIIVCTVMPSTTDTGHATSSFVWEEWLNDTGYSSNGFVFLAGMLNGAFAVGTPDCVSHLAEEIPNPKRNIPLAIAAQMIIGTFTALVYVIAILYAISSLNSVLYSPVSTSFPLAEIYRQATNSTHGSFGLLVLILIPTICACIGTYITAGRTLWTLSRDGATPFASTTAQISQRHKNPFNATLIVAVIVSILGCIYVGSSTAFNAFVGSFVILSTLSYLAAILPFILTHRFASSSLQPPHTLRSNTGNNMMPGIYSMSPVVGYVVNIISCAYILVFIVIYCFPFTMPVSGSNMNYASATVGGFTILIAVFWWVKGFRGDYVGPRAMVGATEGVGAVEGGLELVV